MELFEQIRREYKFGVGTISGVSRKLQVHRRLVREALSSAVPGECKPQERKLRKLQAASAMVDAILIAGSTRSGRVERLSGAVLSTGSAAHPGWSHRDEERRCSTNSRICCRWPPSLLI